MTIHLSKRLEISEPVPGFFNLYSNEADHGVTLSKVELDDLIVIATCLSNALHYGVKVNQLYKRTVDKSISYGIMHEVYADGHGVYTILARPANEVARGIYDKLYIAMDTVEVFPPPTT